MLLKKIRPNPKPCVTLHEHTGRGIVGLTARPPSPSVTRDWLFSISRHPPPRLIRNFLDIVFKVAKK